MLDVYIVSSPKMTLELKFSVSPMLECSLCPDQKREGAESTGQSGERMLRVQGRVVIDYVGCVQSVQP